MHVSIRKYTNVTAVLKKKRGRTQRSSLLQTTIVLQAPAVGQCLPNNIKNRRQFKSADSGRRELYIRLDATFILIKHKHRLVATANILHQNITNVVPKCHQDLTNKQKGKKLQRSATVAVV